MASAISSICPPFPTAELRGMLDDAVGAARRALKAGERSRPLDGKVLAMIFDKPSTRTRVSFDVGMRQLGGETIMLTGTEMQLGRSETIADTAKVLSRYVDAIMIRTTAHERLLELAEHATVPVINGLTDDTHPCQIMADIMTFEEHRGPVAGKTIRLDRRRQQCAALAARGLGALRLQAATSPCRKAASRTASMSTGRKANGGDVSVMRSPEEAVDRRRLRRHRLLGLDGPGAPRPRPQRLPALSGQCRADGARPSRTRCSCTACRPIAARKSPTR